MGFFFEDDNDVDQFGMDSRTRSRLRVKSSFMKKSVPKVKEKKVQKYSQAKLFSLLRSEASGMTTLRKRSYMVEGYDLAVTNPEHKPKKVVAKFKSLLEKGVGKFTVVEARSTMPRSWDYGFYGVFEFDVAKDKPLRAVITINVADKESSGNVTIDSRVVSIPRKKTMEEVVREMASDISFTINKIKNK